MPITFADISWPEAGRYWLADARVPACLLADDAPPMPVDAEGVAKADLLIDGGRIARIAPAGVPKEDAVPVIDLGGRQVWPTLVDIHAHLDKGHTVVRSPNIDGSFHHARLTAAADRQNWTLPDLRRRMDFGLRCAYAHGVRAIRTHLDTYSDNAEPSWQAFREMREEWRGRIDLQAVSLCPIDLLADEFGDRVASLVARSGGLIGGIPRPAMGNYSGTMGNIEALLDRLFALARRHDLNIDMHVDETSDPMTATLPHIARAAIRHGYRGRVVCDHCCSLAMQPEAEIDRTLDLLAEAGIAIVTLPIVNMYLQDRQPGRTPRWRGVTVVREMLRRGVEVAVGGDNCRDAFHAYGDHDMVDTFRQAVRILHVDHPLADTPRLVGATPARIAGFAGHGRIAVGSPARLIVFNARTINEIVSRPHSDRVILDRGERVRAAMPDYSEFWDEQPTPA